MSARTIYFIGIGGIGMSAIARYYLQCGERVHGYDLVRTAITEQLEADGAQIHYEEDVRQIPQDVDFVVYTPAIPQQHAEMVYFREHGIAMYKRSQVLGMLAKGHPTLAVAGTHGKTTTTAMLAQLLAPYRNLMAFIGGIAKNFNSNFLICKDFDTVVVEADEFDRSFLTLFPTIAIITSMDADHLDIYGDRAHLVESFQLFADQIEDGGQLIIHENIAEQIKHPRKLTYGEGADCDFRISGIQLGLNRAEFTLSFKGKRYADIELGVSGYHNVLNGAAAFAAALLSGLSEEEIRQQMRGFSGVKRRFDYRIERDDFVYIDDYAHHPEEIRAIVTAVRKIYADKELTVVFQPHLYTRTRDFATQFAEVLSMADNIILLDIYPAREEPIPGITSEYLLNLITKKEKKLLSKAELIPYLRTHKPEVLLTIGAGNIDRLVAPIEEAFR